MCRVKAVDAIKQAVGNRNEQAVQAIVWPNVA